MESAWITDESVELALDRRSLSLAKGNDTLDKVLYFYYVNISLNAAASLLQLFLMIFMHRKRALKLNLYIKCVILQSFYQCMYDTSLAFSYVCKPEKGASVSHRLCTGILFTGGFTLGGFGAALFSMMILVSATYVVLQSQEPSRRQQYIACGLVHVFMIAWTVSNIFGGYNAGEDPARFGKLLVDYNYARLAIIGMTLATMALLLFKFRQFAPSAELRMRSPLYHLIRKLIWYPVIQITCRIGTLIYNVSYRSSIDKYPADAGRTQFFVLIVFVITAPLAGGLSFLVFLYMTPRSKTNLGHMLMCRCAAATVEEAPPDVNAKKKRRPQSSTEQVQPVGADSNSNSISNANSNDIAFDVTSAQKRQSTPQGLGLGGLTDYSAREDDTEYTYGEGEEDAEADSSTDYGGDDDGDGGEEFNRLSVMDEGELVSELIATETRKRNSARIDASTIGAVTTAGSVKVKSLSSRGTPLAPVQEQESPLHAKASQSNESL